MKSLNPCPLCGNKDIESQREYIDVYDDDIAIYHFVSCQECEILTIGDNEQEVIDKWNNLKVKEAQNERD